MIYKDTPENFSEIDGYVNTDKEQIVEHIILSKKCYFYDACAFRNHMISEEAGLLIQYMKDTEGIVVITRTVLMELCSSDGRLWAQHIAYIKMLYDAGISIFVVYEEDFFAVLNMYCSDVERVNEWLSFAVRCAKSTVGKVQQVAKKTERFRQSLLVGVKSNERGLACSFFQAVRADKESKDNMGEELLAVCIHWLLNIKESEDCKYVVLSDDKKAIPLFSKVIDNAREHAMNTVGYVTTVKLCWLMKKENILTTRQQLEGVMSASAFREGVRVLYSGNYELNPVDRNLSVAEIAKGIMDDEIKVYY